MKFSFEDFFSKCEQAYKKQRICSHPLKKLFLENFFLFFVFFESFLVYARHTDPQKTHDDVPKSIRRYYDVANVV